MSLVVEYDFPESVKKLLGIKGEAIISSSDLCSKSFVNLLVAMTRELTDNDKINLFHIAVRDLFKLVVPDVDAADISSVYTENTKQIVSTKWIHTLGNTDAIKKLCGESNEYTELNPKDVEELKHKKLERITQAQVKKQRDYMIEELVGNVYPRVTQIIDGDLFNYVLTSAKRNVEQKADGTITELFKYTCPPPLIPLFAFDIIQNSDEYMDYDSFMTQIKSKYHINEKNFNKWNSIALFQIKNVPDLADVGKELVQSIKSKSSNVTLYTFEKPTDDDDEPESPTHTGEGESSRMHIDKDTYSKAKYVKYSFSKNGFEITEDYKITDSSNLEFYGIIFVYGPLYLSKLTKLTYKQDGNNILYHAMCSVTKGKPKKEADLLMKIQKNITGSFIETFGTFKLNYKRYIPDLTIDTLIKKLQGIIDTTEKDSTKKSAKHILEQAKIFRKINYMNNDDSEKGIKIYGDIVAMAKQHTKLFFDTAMPKLYFSAWSLTDDMKYNVLKLAKKYWEDTNGTQSFKIFLELVTRYMDRNTTQTFKVNHNLQQKVTNKLNDLVSGNTDNNYFTVPKFAADFTGVIKDPDVDAVLKMYDSHFILGDAHKIAPVHRHQTIKFDKHSVADADPGSQITYTNLSEIQYAYAQLVDFVEIGLFTYSDEENSADLNQFIEINNKYVMIYSRLLKQRKLIDDDGVQTIQKLLNAQLSTQENKCAAIFDDTIKNLNHALLNEIFTKIKDMFYEFLNPIESANDTNLESYITQYKTIKANIEKNDFLEFQNSNMSYTDLQLKSIATHELMNIANGFGGDDDADMDDANEEVKTYDDIRYAYSELVGFVEQCAFDDTEDEVQNDPNHTMINNHYLTHYSTILRCQYLIDDNGVNTINLMKGATVDENGNPTGLTDEIRNRNRTLLFRTFVIIKNKFVEYLNKLVEKKQNDSSYNRDIVNYRNIVEQIEKNNFSYFKIDNETLTDLQLRTNAIYHLNSFVRPFNGINDDDHDAGGS